MTHPSPDPCPYCGGTATQRHGVFLEHTSPTGELCPGGRADPADNIGVPSREAHDLPRGPRVGQPPPRERKDSGRITYGDEHQRKDLPLHRRNRHR